MDPLAAVGVHVVVRHERDKFVETDPGLEARKGCTEAEVAPTTEADQLCRVASEVVTLGIREHRGSRFAEPIRSRTLDASGMTLS